MNEKAFHLNRPCEYLSFTHAQRPLSDSQVSSSSPPTMADDDKAHRLPADTCTNPAQNSDSATDSQPPTAAYDRENLKTKDPDTVHESKRRKSCPSALDKCDVIIKSCYNNNNNSSCSFTFDPKFCSGVTTPEVTPKFGSFNLMSAMTAGIKEKIEEKSGEEEEEKDEIIKKSKIDEFSNPIDGIKSAD
ncbi:hypothetical protein M9H77_28463 [Catharanthus roseus]|uniref:Uncharacterized protein n=1 Tax=Catharanthus roseus TaxID=4058 RepID=A0ACC0AH29_CATRO|nr:hypothetical protein M9H77_28463 [Catharanthus roseus]